MQKLLKKFKLRKNNDSKQEPEIKETTLDVEVKCVEGKAFLELIGKKK
jgi:hypothetical protein